MKRNLGIIIGIGFLFRLLFLGKRQLFTDELMQALAVKASSVAELLESLREGVFIPAPLDFFLQKGVILLLGDSNWGLRFHAVLFGALAIWMVFRIASLLFGDRVAVYTALLFAFMPLHYHYSRESLPYSLFCFLTLLSYDQLFRRIRDGRLRWPGWILLACTLVLLLYSSFLGLIVLVSQLIGLAGAAVLKPGNASGMNEGADSPTPSVRWTHVIVYGLAATTALAIFAPWIQYAWSKPLIAGASEIVDPHLPLRVIKELGDNSYPVSGLLLLGALVGIRALLRHGRRLSLLWLLTWLILSLPMVLLLEYWAGYFFSIAHILHTTPALILLAGYGFSYMGERMTILKRLPYQISSPAIAYASLLIIGSVWIAQSHWGRELVDWRGTAAFLQDTARPGDAIAMPQVYPLLEYHSPQLGDFRTAELMPDPASLRGGEASRRIVVCYDRMKPDPCAGFRVQAMEDGAWTRRQLPAFTIFFREK